MISYYYTKQGPSARMRDLPGFSMGIYYVHANANGIPRPMITAEAYKKAKRMLDRNETQSAVASKFGTGKSTLMLAIKYFEAERDGAESQKQA